MNTVSKFKQFRCEEGNTPLMLAAEKGDEDAVEKLVNEGADVNCYNRFKWTALHHASNNGHLKIVQSLLKNGANIQVETKDGHSPLFLAAMSCHKDVVEFLINAGSDLYCSDKYSTLLNCASKNGWLDIVQSLLEKGVKVNNKHYVSPVLLAAESNHEDIVKYLIDVGADLNMSRGWLSLGENILHQAIRNGWLDMVQSLLKKNVNIEAKDFDGDTALGLAAKCEQKGIVEFLIDAGADINSFDMCYEYTILHSASEEGWTEIVQTLLQKGANIEAKTYEGFTPLQMAVDSKNFKIAEHLINAGADVNVESKDGHSLLSNLIAILPSEINLVRLLIKSGACLKSIDYKIITENSALKKLILQDIELSSQAIINEFNHKDLPELFKQPVACEFLPRIETIRIWNNSQVANVVLQYVKCDVQVNGYCNVLKACPKALKMLSVKSFLNYCEFLNRRRSFLRNFHEFSDNINRVNPEKKFRKRELSV